MYPDGLPLIGWEVQASMTPSISGSLFEGAIFTKCCWIEGIHQIKGRCQEKL
jgi:hypothetical protein